MRDRTARRLAPRRAAASRAQLVRARRMEDQRLCEVVHARVNIVALAARARCATIVRYSGGFSRHFRKTPMLELDSHPSGRHFLQIPGPTNVPDRVLRAIDRPTIDHRGPEFAVLGKTVLAGIKRVFQTEQRCRDLSGVGHRRVGSGAGQHAVARRSRADGRDRPLCDAVEKAGRAACRSSVDFMPGDWRQGANPAEIEKRLRADTGARDQGGVRRPQRDVDRRDDADRADSRGDRSRRPSGAVAWSTRSRRSARSITGTTNGASTSPSAARRKGLMLPPGLSFNAISAKALAASQAREAAALVLGLERDDRVERDRLLPVHAGDQPAVRPARSARDAVCRRPAATCSRGTTAWPKRRGARCARGASKSCAPTRPNTARR